MKGLKLGPHISLFEPRSTKSESTREALLDQKCLSDSSATINTNKLRLLGLSAPDQLVFFFLTPDHDHLHTLL